MSTSADLNTKPCHWCGNYHAGIKCPDVKAVEYHADGTVKRVEFLTPADHHRHEWNLPMFSGVETPS